MTAEVPRSVATELRHADDKAAEWPAYPFLPLTREMGQPPPEDLELAVIIDGFGDTVVLANLVDAITRSMMTGGTEGSEFADWVADQVSIKYRDFDAVLDDGWTID